MQSPVIPTSPAPVPVYFMIWDPLIVFALICAIIYLLHYYKKPHMGLDLSKMAIKPITITTVMLIIALLGPASINIYPRDGIDPIVYLNGMTWQIIGLNILNLMFSAALLLVGVPLMFLRLVFVYQIYKYYLGRTTKRRVLVYGILSEFQLPLITLCMMPLTIGNPSLAFFFSIPIPLLLIIGLVILGFVRVPEPVDGWKELDKGSDWWDQKT